MGYFLAAGGADVPADGVPVGSPALINEMLGGTEQIVNCPPLFR